VRPCRLPACLAVLSAPLLTACANPAPPVLLRPVVPVSLLTCQPQPAPPEGDDTALALWIVDLAAAGEDCRGRLGRIRTLVGDRP
jgi:hypothetical protein